MAKNNKFDLPKIDLPKIDFKALDTTLNYVPPPKFTPPPISKELSRSIDKVMKQMDEIEKTQKEIDNYEKNKKTSFVNENVQKTEMTYDSRDNQTKIRDVHANGNVHVYKRQGKFSTREDFFKGDKAKNKKHSHTVFDYTGKQLDGGESGDVSYRRTEDGVTNFDSNRPDDRSFFARLFGRRNNK